MAVGFSHRIAMKKKQGFSQKTDIFWLKPDSGCHIIPSAEADGNERGKSPGGLFEYQQRIASPPAGGSQ
jgi:hypothetical protein